MLSARSVVGLLGGPALALAVYASLPDSYLGPDGLVAFSHAGRATAAVATWMAVWWLSEPIDVAATALLPPLLLPLLGAASMHDAAAPYAHELVFLFLGGFLIALAMQSSGLHQRIALAALRIVGDRPAHMVGGFMAITAALSMWVSNTAAAIMMLPVATSVIALVSRQLTNGETAAAAAPGSPVHAFAVSLLLGIAYAASLGGVATPIGTPPNLFVLSYLREHLALEVSFVRWMAVAVPLVAVFLPATWWLLTHVLHPIRIERVEGGTALVRDALAALGPASRAERLVLVVFALASLSWIARPLLVGVELAGARPLAGLSDAGIAMLAAMVLFVAPIGGGRFALDWNVARDLPWGILVLFGGGLSLAAAIDANGVGDFLAAQVARLGGVPPLLVVIGVVTLVIFLTELTSNTATAATFVPLLAALAPGLGIAPLLLVVPAAVAASCAFMLPVATPPNAVVFGTGLVRIDEMARAGLWLNLIGIVLITAFAYVLVLPLLG